MCGQETESARAGLTVLVRYHLWFDRTIWDLGDTINKRKVFSDIWCIQCLLLHFLQDIMNKRNPRLVPYNLLDEKTKKTNRETVCAAVRTLIGYGYNIEPPDQESSMFAPMNQQKAPLFNHHWRIDRTHCENKVFCYIHLK